MHAAVESAVSAPWPNFQLCPSSQQMLATPLAYEISRSQIVGMALARNVYFLGFSSPTAERSAFLADIGGYVAVNEDYYVSVGIQACLPM